jgi:hypothetical protein
MPCGRFSRNRDSGAGSFGFNTELWGLNERVLGDRICQDVVVQGTLRDYAIRTFFVQRPGSGR